MRKVITIALLQVFCWSALAALPVEIKGTNLLTGTPLNIPTQFSGKKGLVVVFLSSKCPCSGSHIPEIKSLSEKHPDFQFLAVHSNSDEGKDLAEPYFRSLKLNFEILQDQNLAMADALGAFKTPHSYVISPTGKILYQGGVTNSNRADRADRHYLAEALEDISQGKEVRTSEGRTLGCAITREAPKNVW